MRLAGTNSELALPLLSFIGSQPVEEIKMSAHVVRLFDAPNDVDELDVDRLPGMPLLGLFTGTVLSLTIWVAVGFVAWKIASFA